MDADNLTSKQEKFCQLVAAGETLASAYRGAYSTRRMKPESVHQLACRLARDVKVSSRIEALKAKHAERHDITVDDLVIELEESRLLAHSEKSPSAAVSATMGKGKLLGLIVEKSSSRHEIDFTHFSDQELLAIIEREMDKFR